MPKREAAQRVILIASQSLIANALGDRVPPCRHAKQR
jgi:hypothetical protein